jgi:hypothetical protein
MALTFSQSAQRISVTSPQVSLSCQDLINAIRDEEASERGIVYDQIAQASGKDDLGGGVSTAITVFLLDDWQVQWYAGNYTATIGGGNLVAESGDAVAYVSGGPQVEITLSAAATIVAGDGGGTAPSASEVANAVWAHTSGQELLTKVDLAQAILRNKTITDPATGLMTVYDTDGATPLLTAALFQDAAGTTPYAGAGAERREKLAPGN